uniref:Peptidase S9 prolyl oligopeptidase catalytic domain-containing protein n=1 Tax=Mantoniella antarctica TaxID=81844 RepID=A0A7S0SJ49_9CHLO|mmetsp:Transcript_23060/g.57108  ORF Transcript_23060/g.57108 Transcript_23060/m.57108 type:complete len:152 (+) Transcript_23060:439-894(+)
MCVVGGSHGGFLGAHLIGQAPDMFRCAVLRNPVTDIASMVALTDIPDWCFVETVGREAYADLPSLSTLQTMREASPVHHLSKVKAPVLMLLGAVDLRVPPSNGLRYAAALREAGGQCAVRVFPEDSHGLTNPRTEFESFVTIAGFLREHMA